MDNKLSELSKPVAYSLRFRNMNGEPDKTINANTTFSTLEKAKAYGLGNRYVTQDDGKIVNVRDPSQDPIVEPLYSQEYVSALLAELEANKQTFHLLTNDSALSEAKLEEAQQRIDELSRLLSHNIERAEEAEKRLATPVQLQNCDFESVAIMAHWCTDEQLEAWVSGVEHAKKQIRAVGFRVEGDSE
ncbi:hypothetical protein [Serratia surfactantfaciens]|uniref:hypothetical protein n=1 Tax=Serratia surfactantfaciens TaxID=2741499 RepID=UPI001B3C53AA|nr:hypothetical protein [Serratia surfactantfaciens]